MDWKDVGKGFLQHAPEILGTLGTVVPGVGNLAGTGAGLAIKCIATAFGLPADATPEQVNAAIQADPQAAVTLRLAEMNFALENRRVDVDELRAKQESYIEELRTKSLPWIDGLHKMGRQILNFYTITITFVLLMTGHAVTPKAAALIGGPNILYQFVKGKGQEK